MPRHCTKLQIRFNKLVGPKQENGCTLWTGRKNKAGYGLIRAGGSDLRKLYAHRLAYAFAYGKFDEELHVLHDCPGGDNPSCVNPEHLWLGTNLDNIADMIAKGRQQRGIKHYLATFTEDDIRTIRKRVENGENQHKIAVEFGVTQSCISNVAAKKRWKHIN